MTDRCPLFSCSAYYKGFIHALTHGAYPARAHSGRQARRMVSALGGVEMSLALIAQMRVFLRTQSVSHRHSLHHMTVTEIEVATKFDFNV